MVWPGVVVARKSWGWGCPSSSSIGRLGVGEGTIIANVAATPTRSRPEVEVETQLAEKFVVTPHIKFATRLARQTAASRLQVD